MRRCVLTGHHREQLASLSRPHSNSMRPHILSTVVLFFSLCGLPLAIAASWGFNDATLSVHGKKAGVGGGEKQK